MWSWAKRSSTEVGCRVSRSSTSWGLRGALTTLEQMRSMREIRKTWADPNAAKCSQRECHPSGRHHARGASTVRPLWPRRAQELASRLSFLPTEHRSRRWCGKDRAGLQEDRRHHRSARGDWAWNPDSAAHLLELEVHGLRVGNPGTSYEGNTIRISTKYPIGMRFAER